MSDGLTLGTGDPRGQAKVSVVGWLQLPVARTRDGQFPVFPRPHVDFLVWGLCALSKTLCSRLAASALPARTPCCQLLPGH